MGYEDGTTPIACTSSPGCNPGVFVDACGVCAGDNKTCTDCAGKPYGQSVRDGFGGCCFALEIDCANQCRGSSTRDGVGDCCLMNQIDCANRCNGGHGDACGNCKAEGDPGYMKPGTGGLDVCGSCLKFNDPSFNKTGCVGCDGVPQSGKARDVCGVCGGGQTDSSKCSNGGLGIGPIIAISVGCVAIAGLAVFFYMRRQQNVLKNDIDSLLKQYLPLDAANSLAHPREQGGTSLIPETAARSDNL